MNSLELGQLVFTCGIAKRMGIDKNFSKFIYDSIGRYINCDWGKTCDEDKKRNDEAVQHNNSRILAVYAHPETGEKIWIITEEDRSITTVLFPSEY